MTPLTREQVREVDRRAIEDYGVPGVVLMENAGRGAAEVVRLRLQDAKRPNVAIVCGAGNNGGDGFVCARHLVNHGVPVTLLTYRGAEDLPPDARVNQHIAAAMGIPSVALLDPGGALDARGAREILGSAGVIVDALLGTGFSGAVRPPLDDLITMINAAHEAQRVAMDVPSGLDCNTGRAQGPVVQADVTVTFVAPKAGFDEADARRYVGEVVVVDIGAPRQALDGLP